MWRDTNIQNIAQREIKNLKNYQTEKLDNLQRNNNVQIS